jgi:hypothetical protein
MALHEAGKPPSHTSPDHLLEKAKGVYSSVLVLGWDKDDELNVRSTSTLRCCDLLFLIEQFKHNMLNGDYSDEQD